MIPCEKGRGQQAQEGLAFPARFAHTIREYA
jgi:hypothetical protein